MGSHVTSIEDNYRLENITDLNFTVGFSFIDTDYYTTRTNNGLLLTDVICEKVESGYRMVHEYRTDSLDYVNSYCIDKHGLWIKIMAALYDGLFVLFASDTMINLDHNVKSDIAVPGRMFYVPKSLENDVKVTLRLIRSSGRTFIKKVTINVTKEAGDFWFTRYRKYRVQAGLES